ncbi:MAG: ATP-binding cassette domain-containing protein, partial [Candidatus Aminicenantes bacterium]|nr:ATP-binding cassette domain-containing protein [Candidatus Aminicenantes bacterium]
DLGVEAVRGVSFSVNAGEFTCLLGSSGCGKSTLLNLAAGFLKPTSGSVRIDGREVAGPGPDRCRPQGRARELRGRAGRRPGPGLCYARPAPRPDLAAAASEGRPRPGHRPGRFRRRGARVSRPPRPGRPAELTGSAHTGTLRQDFCPGENDP